MQCTQITKIRNRSSECRNDKTSKRARGVAEILRPAGVTIARVSALSRRHVGRLEDGQPLISSSSSSSSYSSYAAAAAGIGTCRCRRRLSPAEPTHVHTTQFRACKTNFTFREKFANFNKLYNMNELYFFDNFNSVNENLDLGYMLA